jgi:DNA (cytosine-5)-methyltransferase 1
MSEKSTANRQRLAVGLFAGVGGIELGLERAGFKTELLAENYPPAHHVLRSRFPDAKLYEDIRTLRQLPEGTEVVAAGFPCQDLSSVGLKTGIAGTQSSLVGEVFRLLEQRLVPWVVLENVPFILDLDKGRALTLITTALEELGYRWAYRVIDAECFGLPQRRRRWFLVASLVGDPRASLLASDAIRPIKMAEEDFSYGFYWTEGTRALGLSPNSIPPIKCGSTVGVPSPPAILLPTGEVVTPEIRDAERLQGFRSDWTKPAEEITRPSFRWKLVGNAVSVRTSTWVAKRIAKKWPTYDASRDTELVHGGRWPKAAWWDGDNHGVSKVSDTPVWRSGQPIQDFLQFPPKLLSARACNGFLLRAEKGNLRFVPGFLDAVRAHASRQEITGGGKST